MSGCSASRVAASYPMVCKVDQLLEMENACTRL